MKYKAKLRESVAQNRVAKRDYERKPANDVKSNSKSFFAYVRSKQRTKDRVGLLKNMEGNVVVDDGEAASLLNVYFILVVFLLLNIELKFHGLHQFSKAR